MATHTISDGSILFRTQSVPSNIGRHKYKIPIPPYIIPSGLDYSPEEIESAIKSPNQKISDIGIKYLIENDDFYIAKVVLKYNKTCEEIHRPMLHDIMTNKMTMALYPRGIYKTTIRTICSAICKIRKNPNISILIIMNSATNAVKVLSEIKSQILMNARLKYYIGNWHEGAPRWQANSIILGCRDKNSPNKTGTIDAAGKETKLTSQHYDVIYLDDIADEDDRDSEAERERTRKTFEDAFDLLNPGGEMHITGTRWHFDDIYNHVESKVNPALEKDNLDSFNITIQPVRNEDHSLRFPEFFTERKLADLLKKKGIVSYSAQYDLQPLAGDNTIFLPENCGYFDMERFNPSEGICYGYIDPALGKSKKGCQAPILTAYYMIDGIYEGKVLLVHADVNIRRTSASAKLIVKNHMRYNYSSFGVEDNGMQELFLSEIDAEARRISERIYGDPKKDGYKPILVPLFGITNTRNKDARIESFEKYYTTQRILFRSDYETAPGNYINGMNSLWQYPFAKYKDFPDALECLMTRVIIGGAVHIGA